jgi:hypothetical protein
MAGKYGHIYKTVADNKKTSSIVEGMSPLNLDTKLNCLNN